MEYVYEPILALFKGLSLFFEARIWIQVLGTSIFPQLRMLSTSVADPGCLSGILIFIPDPDFFIQPDPGYNNKEEGEKFCCRPFCSQKLIF
jgi:hypothetical protein